MKLSIDIYFILPGYVVEAPTEVIPSSVFEMIDDDMSNVSFAKRYSYSKISTSRGQLPACPHLHALHGVFTLLQYAVIPKGMRFDVEKVKFFPMTGSKAFKMRHFASKLSPFSFGGSSRLLKCQEETFLTEN